LLFQPDIQPTCRSRPEILPRCCQKLQIPFCPAMHTHMHAYVHTCTCTYTCTSTCSCTDTYFCLHGFWFSACFPFRHFLVVLVCWTLSCLCLENI
jgi:hypothetical protein